MHFRTEIKPECDALYFKVSAAGRVQEAVTNAITELLMEQDVSFACKVGKVETVTLVVKTKRLESSALWVLGNSSDQ